MGERESGREMKREGPQHTYSTVLCLSPLLVTGSGIKHIADKYKQHYLPDHMGWRVSTGKNTIMPHQITVRHKIAMKMYIQHPSAQKIGNALKEEILPDVPTAPFRGDGRLALHKAEEDIY